MLHPLSFILFLWFIAGFMDAIMDRILWGIKNDPDNNLKLWIERLPWFQTWLHKVGYYSTLPVPKDAWHGIKFLKYVSLGLSLIPAALLPTETWWEILLVVFYALLAPGMFMVSKTFWYEMGLWENPIEGLKSYYKKVPELFNRVSRFLKVQSNFVYGVVDKVKKFFHMLRVTLFRSDEDDD